MPSVTTDRISGLNASVAIKAPVKAATTANITLSGEQTIDGVAVQAFTVYGGPVPEDDRVLVKNQTDTTQNGIYKVRTSAWARARDFDGTGDAIKGTLVFVRSGTVNANSYWRLTSDADPVVFGTSAITFATAGIFWPSIVWRFDDSTTMADPSAGNLRFNHATLSSVTAIAISATSADSQSDVSDYVAAWDDSTSTTVYGTLIIKEIGAPENFAAFNVTAAVTDNTAWLQIGVTWVASAGSFSDTDGLTVDFTRTGNKGDTGATGAAGANGANGADGADGVGIETGTVVDYAGTTEPSGWLFCYGQAVSRTTYAALFAVIGTTYGVGDGSTTFNLPDLRGRVVAGQDDMGGVSANRLTNASGGVDGDVLGAAGGAETHTLTTAEIAAHAHGGGAVATGHSSVPNEGGPALGSTDSAGGGGAHNNVQPTIVLNKIIKT